MQSGLNCQDKINHSLCQEDGTVEASLGNLARFCIKLNLKGDRGIAQCSLGSVPRVRREVVGEAKAGKGKGK